LRATKAWRKRNSSPDDTASLNSELQKIRTCKNFGLAKEEAGRLPLFEFNSYVYEDIFAILTMSFAC
jgi:hypothetical protein